MRSTEFGGEALLARLARLLAAFEDLAPTWHRSHLIALAHSLWVALGNLQRTGDHNWPRAEPALDPVGGDILPAVGTRVRIHLASCDEWVEHTVVGYYVWPAVTDRGIRIFVRVRDEAGYLNSRFLHEVRPL